MSSEKLKAGCIKCGRYVEYEIEEWLGGTRHYTRSGLADLVNQICICPKRKR